MKKQADPKKTQEPFEFPLEKIITRLDILKNQILLEDIEELNGGVSKLKEYDFNPPLSEILDDLDKQAFSSAVRKIDVFISENRQIDTWNDPEIEALKLEIKTLENELNAYDNEKIELEKVLSEFQHRHAVELGDIVLEILELKKLKFQADETESGKKKYEEAKQDEKQYREQVSTEKKKEIFELNEEEQNELKKKFRKASIKCHPDRASDEFKEEARKTFIDLKNAFDKNDLEKVSDILEQLEKGSYIKTKSDTISKKDLLKAELEKLRSQVQNLEEEITTIRESDTYQTINDIEDWDKYFESTKEKLEKELATLQTEREQSREEN